MIPGPQMQQGQVFKRNGAWHLRFYRDEIVGGKAARKRVAVRLAPINDQYRSKKDLDDEIAKHLAPVNTGAVPEGGLTFADFYLHHFIPHLEAQVKAGNRKHSLVKFYRDIFRFHLRDRVGTIRLRDFTTAHAQKVLDSISLNHQSLLRIKTGMSAAFTIARQKDFIRTANPIVGARAEGRRIKFKGYAYTLEEIKYMLEKLPEPARTVVAVAAFTGMREGEIRGLRWSDYSGTMLEVKRAVWRTHVEHPKTEESDDFVPVMKPLRRILDAHREQAVTEGDAYIFAGLKKGAPLRLDNLVARSIRPTLGERWHGWHAFRRGLTTNLWELGVPAEVSQHILRHADVETTRKHYLMLHNQKQGAAAMKTLEAVVTRRKVGQQMGNSPSGPKLAKNKKSPRK